MFHTAKCMNREELCYCGVLKKVIVLALSQSKILSWKIISSRMYWYTKRKILYSNFTKVKTNNVKIFSVQMNLSQTHTLYWYIHPVIPQSQFFYVQLTLDYLERHILPSTTMCTFIKIIKLLTLHILPSFFLEPNSW